LTIRVFETLLQGALGNTALNGAFWATENRRILPLVGEDGNSFTATWTATLTDLNGNNIIPPGNGTITAVRGKVEP
jgi:hypothetical protein